MTLAKLAARRRRVPLARADPRLRPLSLLHRRPDARRASSATTARRAARALYCSVDPERLPAARACRRAGTSAISAPTAPTASRRSSGCSSSRRAARPTCASSSPGRSTRPTSPGRPTSSASSTCRRPSTRPSTPPAASRSTSPARDMIAAGYSPSVRLFEAAACGTPIVSDDWQGLDTLFAPARGIILADDRRRRPRAPCACPRPSRRDRRRGARRASSPHHTAERRAAELEATSPRRRAAVRARPAPS